MNIEILYNEASQCLIIAAPRQMAKNIWTQELKYRHILAPNFTEVPSLSSDIAYLNPRSCENSPTILFNVWSISADFSGGYNWKEISSLELPSGNISSVLTAADLSVPEGYVDMWPNTLVWAKSKGDGAICSVGFKRQVSQDCFKIDYWLCEINFSSKKFRQLMPLDDIVI